MPLFGPPDVEKLEAKRDVRGLVRALGYKKDAKVRQAAAEALGRIGDPVAVGGLVAALGDERGVRGAAIEALAEIGKSAVEPLISVLEDADWAVRRSATTALTKIGDPAVAQLIAAFLHGGASTREGVTRALGGIGNARALPTVLDALDDRCTEVRRAAAGALEKIGDASAAQSLVVALTDEDPVVRTGAASALGAIRDVRAVGSLIAALIDEDSGVRVAAARALATMRARRALEPLTVCLEDGERSVRRAATEALDSLGWRPRQSRASAAYWVVKGEWGKCVKIGAPAVEPLIAALGDTRKSVRGAAAKALVRIHESGRLGSAHHPTLKAALRTVGAYHQDYSVRINKDCPEGHTDYRSHTDRFFL
jgi:HEAT repeat protein